MKKAVIAALVLTGFFCVVFSPGAGMADELLFNSLLSQGTDTTQTDLYALSATLQRESTTQTATTSPVSTTTYQQLLQQQQQTYSLMTSIMSSYYSTMTRTIQSIR